MRSWEATIIKILSLLEKEWFVLWHNEGWQCLCDHFIKSCASLGSVESSGEQYVMFADWAAGLLDTTPDPVTSEKHVASMVEVGSIFAKLEELLFGSVSKTVFVRNHWYGNVFPLQVHFHTDQTHFHIKGFGWRLVLKLRHKAAACRTVTWNKAKDKRLYCSQ